ncbi:MAG: acyltransferase [Nitrospira sp.]|nr:acyltransferase [Nitrospira sp.]
MLNAMILKIKRRKTPIYDFLYRCLTTVRSSSMPSIKWIHLPLYHLDQSVRRTARWLIGILWHAPLFKARCERVGAGLKLPDGMPYLIGSHLRLRLGENVLISRTTIGASKVFDSPLLEVGNSSTIGYGTTISVAKQVTIGNSVLIGPCCTIMDSDDHPIDPVRRVMREPVNAEDVKPVTIGNNVWIGAYCTILKGVTIGDNSIISAHSVIVRDVLPNCIYAGNPARPTVRDIDKKHEMPQSVVGSES